LGIPNSVIIAGGIIGHGVSTLQLIFHQSLGMQPKSVDYHMSVPDLKIVTSRSLSCVGSQSLDGFQNTLEQTRVWPRIATGVSPDPIMANIPRIHPLRQ
jgi:hypothetical protein